MMNTSTDYTGSEEKRKSAEAECGIRNAECGILNKETQDIEDQVPKY
jgi:hypothetical protein